MYTSECLTLNVNFRKHSQDLITRPSVYVHELFERLRQIVFTQTVSIVVYRVKNENLKVILADRYISLETVSR